jgi:acylphosphatase
VSGGLDGERRVQFRVRGRVQGVGFRAHTQAKALALQLSGFVENEPDGAVLGAAQGSAAAVAALLDWLHIGPPAARVAAVEMLAVELRSDVQPFQVRR